MRPSSRRVVIIGGGITGLACAYALRGATDAGGALLDVTLLEGSSRLGGNIKTERTEGLVLDSGPDAWVVNKPHATELARELGLESELVATIPENRRVYIAWEGRLHPMPEGLVLGIPTEMGPFMTTPLLSWEGKLRAGFDLFIPSRRYAASDDESVGDFVARRLGEEVADRLVGPLLGGIFAGDAYRISVRAAFASLVEAEEKHGSLIRAMRANRKAGARPRPAPSAFTTLRGGMGVLIDKLAESLRVDDHANAHVSVRLGVRARGIVEGGPNGARYGVKLDGDEVLDADDVVCALPVRESAPVLESLDGTLARVTNELMSYASTVAVFLAWPRDAVDHQLDATGFIVPKAPGHALLAATFVTSKWADRAPPGTAVFRVFLGGDSIDEILAKDDAAIVELARRELARFVPARGAPSFSLIARHRLASPQPAVGHHARRAQVYAELARFPGIHIAASGIEGVGIPDCIKQAQTIATRIASVEPAG